jgi:hypothetical protein
MALTEKLTNIAVAIREKTGTEDKLTLEQMATAIAGIETGGGSGGEDGVPETVTFTGNQLSGTFKDNKWRWFIENYGDRIRTNGITYADKMFENCSSYLKAVPFEINTTNAGCNFSNAFYGCHVLETIPPLAHVSTVGQMFYGCRRLRELPEITCKTGGVTGYEVFKECYSLRTIPEEFLKGMYNASATYNTACPIYNSFSGLYALDEIRGLNPKVSAIKVNVCASIGGLYGFQRLKEFIFATQDDGTPYTVKLSGQILDLTNVGVLKIYDSALTTDYNSGITADKKVTNDTEYASLKNDPDWFSGNKMYSRYNLQSAINTINSLPDTTEYLATTSGTNTIKFNYYEGANTDGGKIGNMTEEQIAIATAKGWTVSITQQ